MNDESSQVIVFIHLDRQEKFFQKYLQWIPILDYEIDLREEMDNVNLQSV